MYVGSENKGQAGEVGNGLKGTVTISARWMVADKAALPFCLGCLVKAE
jgi:hypothetical protein